MGDPSPTTIPMGNRRGRVFRPVWFLYKKIKMNKLNLYNIHTNTYGFDGICLAKDIDKLAGMNISCERPTLYQISVAVMKHYSYVKLG